MTPTAAPGLRQDAARNRSRILQSAARLFAERGARADVRQIADAAGVGMGTLYRHFPTKEALLDAAIHHDLIEWAEAAQATVTSDPGHDLRSFLEDALARHATHRALLDSFGTSLGDTPNVQECRRRIRPVITALVTRAQQAGALRPDVTATDLHVLLLSLGRIVHLGPAAWRRQLHIALDGLSTPAPSPIRTSPLTHRQLDRAIASPGPRSRRPSTRTPHRTSR